LSKDKKGSLLGGSGGSRGYEQVAEPANAGESRRPSGQFEVGLWFMGIIGGVIIGCDLEFCRVCGGGGEGEEKGGLKLNIKTASPWDLHGRRGQLIKLTKKILGRRTI